MKYIIAGIFGGIIGGMGMGGGTLLIPILTIMLGISQKSAQLINMISFIPLAFMTIFFNAKQKLIKWKYIVYVGISGTISAIISSLLVSMIASDILRIVFAIFLILLGVYSILSLIIKKYRQNKSLTLTSINMTKEEEN